MIARADILDPIPFPTVESGCERLPEAAPGVVGRRVETGLPVRRRTVAPTSAHERDQANPDATIERALTEVGSRSSGLSVAAPPTLFATTERCRRPSPITDIMSPSPCVAPGGGSPGPLPSFVLAFPRLPGYAVLPIGGTWSRASRAR